MKKQHALTLNIFERLGLAWRQIFSRRQANFGVRRKHVRRTNVGDLSAHIRKDIGL
jgi:hypothetical protein